ncbi:hypothetical protein B0H14DRAFT_3499223 [Mycena olivaceomarginata]|nr:hypothetical protein B0H14DRAFT_3499223 [Mycena olivaceomarginata]
MDPKELNKIRDQLKIKPGKKKTDLIDSILTTSSTQRSMTEFFSKGKAKAGTEQPKGQQEDYARCKLVKIDEDVYNILLRVHIAYFAPLNSLPKYFPVLFGIFSATIPNILAPAQTSGTTGRRSSSM